MTTDRSPAGMRIRPSVAFYAIVWVGFPLIGALGGWVLSFALEWILDLAWVPVQGPLQTIDDITGSWTTVILVALGFFIGVVVAFAAYAEIEFVTIGPERVIITLDGEDRLIERSDIAAVFIESKSLVLQDAAGRQHVRSSVADLPHDQLHAEFTRQGYPWVEADPRADQFTPWVLDAPALPPGANALLAGRQAALDSGEASDVEEFRVELTKIGVVVRDEKKKQYWRSVG